MNATRIGEAASYWGFANSAISSIGAPRKARQNAASARDRCRSVRAVFRRQPSRSLKRGRFHACTSLPLSSTASRPLRRLDPAYMRSEETDIRNTAHVLATTEDVPRQ